MNDQEFELLDRIEDDHWWFVGKRHLLQALLERHAGPGAVLDLGCGTGGILREISGDRPCVGMDRSQLALRICQAKGFRQLARGDLTHLPFAAESFDTVLALDVIEHLDDDRGFLVRARELCEGGGRLIIAVPAFQSLWSAHDETFQHKRRYNAAQLRTAMEAAGLRIERTTYTNCFTFPLAAAWRLIGSRLGLDRMTGGDDFVSLPRWLNSILIAVYRLEAALLGRLDLPFGLSVVCVASPRSEG